MQAVSRTSTIINGAALAGCAAPLLWLAIAVPAGLSGADPVEDITHLTGIWSLRFLLLVLTLTPLRLVTGWQWPLRLRRMVGLSAFLYAALHLLAYLVFEQSFDLGAIAADLSKRPHLGAGLIGFALMLPLAATSSDAAIRRLGFWKWRRLHRLAYPSAAAGVFHYLWLVKQDVTAPSMYGLVLLVLAAARFARSSGKRREKATGAGPGTGLFLRRIGKP